MGESVYIGVKMKPEKQGKSSRPVKTLTDYLEAGDSIDVFLDDFPCVSRPQVIAFIEQAH